MDNSNKFSLSIAIVIASIILGIFFFISREKDNSVKVVGYAIEAFESDIIRWSFNISETTNQFELKTGYKKLNDKINNFKKIINTVDLDSLELLYKPIRINDIYDRNGITSDKKLTQDIILTSNSIEKIELLSTNPEVFIDKNILFEYSNIDYYYTKLDEIKKELLGKAIVNAKERASEILTAAGNNVGDLTTARSGVFQITEPLSTEVAGYGMHSTSTKKKNIKVTVSAEFEIE
jgi:hypothetical protein